MSTFGRDLELLDGKLRLHPGGETKTDILLTLGEKQWCVRKLVEPAAHRGQNNILKLAEVKAVGRKMSHHTGSVILTHKTIINNTDKA